MRFFVVLLCVLLAGCANNRVILPLAVADQRYALVETIHVATTRELAKDPLEVFSGNRSNGLNFGEVDVSVPRNRDPGSIEYPHRTPNLKTQFAAVRYVTNRDEASFIAAVNRSLQERVPKDRVVLLFVHGYNTNFAAGVFRQAQMVHDFKFPGVAVNFSWASAGKAPLYLYDRDSAHLARNSLRNALRVLNKTNARHIVLLGHSMGAFVTMEALREINIREQRNTISKLEAVVLASPDIDTAVFDSQLADLRPIPQPFILFVSRNDRALQFSQTIRGGTERLGEGSNIQRLQDEGITVVDLSDIGDGGDRTNHSTFATSKTVMAMIQSGALQRANKSAEQAALAPVGEGIGRLSDIASQIIYLPAKVAGVR